MKILIYGLNYEENSLTYDEFVLPLFNIAKKFGEINIVHYTRLTKEKYNKLHNNFDAVILSGTTLKIKNI